MKSTQRTLACVSSVAFIGLMLTVSTNAAIDPADIIAVWLFDEGEGDVVEDASGNPKEAWTARW